MLVKFLASAIATGVGSFALAYSVPPLQPHFEIQVITYSGDLFIAGSGDDCRSAWEAAHVPKGWQTIRCVEVSR